MIEEVGKGERFRVFFKGGFGAGLTFGKGRYDVTSGFASIGADVDEVVGLSHDGFVMLDDDEGVSFVTKIRHDFGEAVDVAVVKADGGLVEDEEGLSES